MLSLSVAALFALSPWLGQAAFAASEGTASPVPTTTLEPEPLPAAPDLKGLRRDTWYFLGYQFVAVGVLYALPTEVTGFERDGEHLEKWWDNVTHPGFDDDDFYINYILHPYWGATYYVRGRERGLSKWGSFGYSALLSTLYEFGAEAFFEKPSYQDLVVTPVVGALLGEFLFTPIRDRIKAKEGPLDGTDRFLLVMTDPLGAANDVVNRMFGVQTQVALVPFRGLRGQRTALRPRSAAMQAGAMPATPWFDPPRQRGPTWGLQLEVRW